MSAQLVPIPPWFRMHIEIIRHEAHQSGEMVRVWFKTMGQGPIWMDMIGEMARDVPVGMVGWLPAVEPPGVLG